MAAHVDVFSGTCVLQPAARRGRQTCHVEFLPGLRFGDIQLPVPVRFCGTRRVVLFGAGERPSLQPTYNAARAVHPMRCGLHTRDAARGSCSTLLLYTQARCKFNQSSCSLEGKFMIWVGFFRNEHRAARFCLINNEKESFRTAGS